MNRFDVSGQVAIVTGGASGLGLAYAEAMVEGGAKVVLMDRDAAALGAARDRFAEAGTTVETETLDVTDEAGLDRAFDAVAGRHGRIDILFANAGIDPGPGFEARDETGARDEANRFEQYDFARWKRVIDINLDGVFLSLRAGARHMRPTRSGSMIVTTSISALRPAPALGAAYMASKSAAAHLVRTLALELAEDGVRVNAIAPGPFLTNIADGAMQDPVRRAAFASIVPLGRIADTDEIKGLALFLASGASGFVTGQQIAIDGGASLRSARA